MVSYGSGTKKTVIAIGGGASRPVKAFSKAASGPALLLLLYIAFFWRLTLSHQFTWLESPDPAYQIVPWIQVQARAFHTPEFPLWDPYEWGGQSLIGQMQPGTAYPLNWLLFALPLKHGFVRQIFLHWYFVLIHYLGGLFCYFLCRSRGLGLFAALAGGCAFGMTGWMGGTDWPQMLNGAIWAPLIFLFLLRALPAGGSTRDAGLAGAFLGMSFLSGHHQIPTFLTLAAGAVFVYLWVLHGKWKRWGEAAGKTGLFGLLAVLVSGFQTVPGFEYGRSAIRWASANIALGWKSPVPYGIHEQFSLAPAALLDIVIPHPWADSRIFVGWALLALAFLGVVTAWKDRGVRVFAFLAAGSLLFALGGHSIYHGLGYILVPLVEKARSPAAATFLFDFAVSVLAATGAAQLRQGALGFGDLRTIYRFLYGAAAAFAVLAAAKIDADASALGALAALLAAILFHVVQRRRVSPGVACAMVGLIAFFELGSVSASRFLYRDQPGSPMAKLYSHADIAAFLLTRSEPSRVELDRDVIPYNFGDWYGIDVFDGYTASMPVSVNRISGAYWGRMLMSLRYSLGLKPLHEGETAIFAGAGGVQVFENADAFPRAWSVHKTTLLRSDEEILPRMLEAKSAMRTEALLTQTAPPLDTCAGNDVVVLAPKGMNRVSIDARMHCRGMVVASEVYAPGWHAYVDGKPAKIWPAYTFLRGVVVPAGEHRIEMIYRPMSVMAGAAMSLTGILAALFLLLRRSPPRDPRAL